jgi:serine/threonine protein kinase
MSVTVEQIKKCLLDIGAMTEPAFHAFVNKVRGSLDGNRVLKELQAEGALTPFQASEIEAGVGRELRVGNYLLLNQIGQGGMGTVYKALHVRMNRVVALKVMRRNALGDDDFVPRFQREVHAAARLNHPNVIAAFDADESDIGLFLVMEYVDGTDLEQVIQKKGALSIDEAVSAIRQGAEGLAFAHAHGIVHRDMKPANLIRDLKGVVKVADLGLALLQSHDRLRSDAPQGTMKGFVAGTLDYMSPEQALDTSMVDHRADIYSLGCTLFYLLTCRPLYPETTTAGRILAHRQQPVPSLRKYRPEAPELLDDIFQKMVAKRPEDRFSSMREVVEHLDQLTRKSGPPRPAWEPESTTVLLAEPSRLQASVMQKHLTHLGVNDLYTFQSGQEAIDALGELPATLLLTTMQLPDMTGIELAQHLRDKMPWSRLAILLMTSSDLSAETLACIERLPGVDKIDKPFDHLQLGAAIERVMSVEGVRGTVKGLEEKHVLIVDDSGMWRMRLQRVLESLGFARFTMAADGVEAVAHLRERDFDLIVTDFHMPNMDGKELVRVIRQSSSRPNVPIVMVTTEYDPLKLGEVYKLGASAICHKSFDPHLVRNIVMRLFM